MRVPSNPMMLIGPAVLLIFALCFILVWMNEKQRRHLLFFGAANCLFCMGALVQLLSMPPDLGQNAILSALIYSYSVLLFCDGLLRRSGSQLSAAIYVLVPALIISGIAYFYYADRQVLVRIYILNYGFAVIFLMTAWRLRALSAGKLAERVFFWVFLIFALHFFPRTFLTVGGVPNVSSEFAATTFWLVLQFSLAFLGVALALALLAVTVSDMLENLGRERSYDLLTGVLNRRGFEEACAKITIHENSWPIQVMAVDIDYFKIINDTYGHAAGDVVLREMGKLLLDSLHSGDICGRLGGEEFALVLSKCDRTTAHHLADRLRSAVAQKHFKSLPEGRGITVSIGLAAAMKHESLMFAIDRADQALYRAKNTGRNQVVAAYENRVV